MESSEIAARVEGFSSLLLVAPGPIAAMAGFIGIALLAIGGVAARRH